MAEKVQTSKRKSGRPTIADVARRAGVGVMTVSRALREPDRVSPPRRRRIASAIEELGYVPNRHARALAADRADIVAVLIPSLGNNVFSEVVRGLYAGLGDSHLQIQIGNTHYSGAEEERLLQVFLGQRPSAVVVSGIDQTPAARAMLESAACPVVQIMELGERPVDLMVGFSHLEAGRIATRHLADQGYRRIAFLCARMDPRAERRLQGYREVLSAAGLYDPALVTVSPDSTSVTLGVQLLTETLAKAPDVDALFCNNDDVALGALFECSRLGLPVPGRIGISGFNDFDMMSVAQPSMTSVRTPRFEIGRKAMELALAALAGRPPDARVVDVGFELQVRDSTRRAPI
jgi:LacI family gluconate utilization system Gnt-I transcriptional repressor